MKRISFMVTLLIAVSLIMFSQMSCQPSPDTNRAAPIGTPTTRNSEAETVDTAAVQAELMRIENDWPRVLKEKDVEAVRRVEADDIVAVYPDGQLGNKQRDVQDMQSGALSADSWEVTDLQVKVIDKDAAVASGRSIVKGGKYKSPDGKVINLSGQYRFVDTFARRNGEWKLVASAAIPIMKPEASSSPSMASSAAGTTPAAKASPTAKVTPAAAKSASPAMKPKTTP
jgi:ketosteroid isomerase-like protein